MEHTESTVAEVVENFMRGVSWGDTPMIEEATDQASDHGIVDVKSFADAGLMTSDAGVVITTEDGAEYQITVIRRR